MNSPSWVEISVARDADRLSDALGVEVGRVEISEEELIAADLARNERKAERWHQVNDAAAGALDLQHLDAMRRAGL